MQLFRYEFAGDGLFNALDYLYDIDMEQTDAEDFKIAEEYFEKNLPAVTGINLSKPFRFYFTEEGNIEFGPYIDTFIRLFQKYCSSEGSVEVIKLEAPDNRHTIYHDKYQMVIQHSHY